MEPKWHILYSYIFILLLYKFTSLNLFAIIVIFLAAIFIDLDHAARYSLITKNINPIKFLKWSTKRKEEWENLINEEKSKYKKPHFIFHGVEFLLIIVFFSFLHKFFLWILIGVSFHLFLDLIFLIYKKEHLSIKTSQIWLWQKNKNKKEFVLS